MSLIVYGLVNPVNKMIYYVGITNNLNIREKQHKISRYDSVPKREVLQAINYSRLEKEIIVLEKEGEGRRIGVGDEIKWLQFLLEADNYLVNINNVPKKYKSIALKAADFHAKACYASKLGKGLMESEVPLEDIKEKAGLPRKHGKCFSKEEMKAMWLQFSSGDSIMTLASNYQRSAEVVLSELEDSAGFYGAGQDKRRLFQEKQQLFASGIQNI